MNKLKGYIVSKSIYYNLVNNITRSLKLKRGTVINRLFISRKIITHNGLLHNLMYVFDTNIFLKAGEFFFTKKKSMYLSKRKEKKGYKKKK